MNPPRRLKSLVHTPHDDPTRRRVPTPTASPRNRADKAAGSAWLFADFLAACLTLPHDQLADLE